MNIGYLESKIDALERRVRKVEDKLKMHDVYPHETMAKRSEMSDAVRQGLPRGHPDK